jgi:hypothetical protein
VCELVRRHPTQSATSALVTLSAYSPSGFGDPEFPLGAYARRAGSNGNDQLEQGWVGWLILRRWLLGAADDERGQTLVVSSYLRFCASPRAVLLLSQANTQIDVRHIFAYDSRPYARSFSELNDLEVKVEEGRYICHDESPRSKICRVARAYATI